MKKPIKVTVHEKQTYWFPNDENKCPAHGQPLCIRCARTGSGCNCGYHDETGMHWDTCPARIR